MDRISKQSGIKIIFGVGLLAWVLLRSRPGEIAAALQSVSLGFFFFILALYLVSFVINAGKWRWLLQGGSLRELFVLILVGQYYSTIIPGQIAGEAVKCLRLSQGKPDAERITASVAFDRITGLVAITAVTLLGLLASRTGFFISTFGGYLLVPFAILISPILLRSDSVARSVKRALLYGLGFRRRTAKLLRFSFGLIDACRRYLQQPGLLFGAVLLGVGLHGICIVMVMALGSELGIDLTFPDWCWVFGLVSLVVFLPITIGGIGLREGGFVVLLGRFDVAPESALALSLTLLAMQLTVALVGGILEMRYRIQVPLQSSSESQP